jgi:7-carboxy-7-deazaguanine synthase
MSREGYIAEVFRSFQGEGPSVGILQLFVRLAGCGLCCSYCDTPEARDRSPRWRLYDDGGVRTFDNPVAADVLASRVRALAAAAPRIHSVSVTGGEPLEQCDFLLEFLPLLRGASFSIHLETNGLVEPACRDVRGSVDVVSLDIKLPSLCGGGDLFSVYGRVLPLFASKELIIKVVVTDAVEETEFVEAVRLVAGLGRPVPFIIQPAYMDDPGARVRAATLFALHRAAAERLADVRVIPQCHRMMGVP